jgi:hypothetical protein
METLTDTEHPRNTEGTMRVVNAFACVVFALLVFAAIRDSNANPDFACYGKARCVKVRAK